MDPIDTAANRMSANLYRANRWMERFAAQVKFAEALAELPDVKAGRWPRLIRDAWAIVNPAVESGKLDRLPKAVRAAEELLAPIGKVAKKYTVLNVGHGHIDMNWMWSWPETVSATNDTCRTMLRLMDEFDDFTYSQSQASVYAIIAEHNPEMLEQIRRRVAEGRWEVTASHWVEGDKNLASGESLARHLLYTRQFVKQQFGLDADDVAIDWSPDTFGHAHTIPSIDSRGGVKFYYMCRGGEGMGAFSQRPHTYPPVFWWQGPDGRRLLVYLETSWYNDTIDEATPLKLVDFASRTGLKSWMNVYGVGDHGGGPTRRDILRLREMNDWPIFPTFRFSTTREFYKLLEAEGERWPVIDRELNYEFTGCYTSQALIKRVNRLGENICLDGELAAALAWRALGSEYPAERLRDAWTNILFGQFHDILPGSGVRATRHYQSALFQNTAATCTSIKTNAYRELAGQVDTSFAAAGVLDEGPTAAQGSLGGGAGLSASKGSLGFATAWGEVSMASSTTEGPRPFVVFNPTASRRDEVVELMIWDSEPKDAPREYRLRGPHGSLLPAQRLEAGTSWEHRFVKLAVPVSVEPMGYASLSIERGAADAPGENAATSKLLTHQPVLCRYMASSRYVLENEHLLVELDAATGGVRRLVDKSTGNDLGCPDDPMAALVYAVERPMGMSSWVRGQVQESFAPEVQVITPLGKGPWLAGFEVTFKINDSEATLRYTLAAGSRRLAMSLRVNWLERGSRETGVPSLSMRFPMALVDAGARYEIPFGSIQRDLSDGQEVPALRWACVAGTCVGGDEAGLALFNDCKYGHSLDGSTLSLTLIRSSWDPDPLPEIGEHEMRLALSPTGAALETGELVQAGADFNHPLIPVATNVHEGGRPSEAGLLEVGPKNVVLTSLRKAADDDAIVIHLLETAGRAVTARVELSGALLGEVVDAEEVDLIERPIEGSLAKVSGQSVSAELGAYGIAALRVKLK
jgi:alpha-mannosidase